jgi:hypothetical protein
MLSRRRLFGAACACVLLASACATPASSAKNDFKDQGGMQQEAMAEYNSLAWPSGAPNLSFAPAQSFRYQAGLGTSHTDLLWVCSWSQDWLDSREADSGRAAADLKTLAGVTNLPLWNSLDDPGKSNILDVLARAKLGDPAPMITLRAQLSC